MSLTILRRPGRPTWLAWSCEDCGLRIGRSDRHESKGLSDLFDAAREQGCGHVPPRIDPLAAVVDGEVPRPGGLVRRDVPSPDPARARALVASAGQGRGHSSPVAEGKD